MTDYFKLEGNKLIPCKMFDAPCTTNLFKTQITIFDRKYEISTVFISNKHVLFETMIFSLDDLNNDFDEYQERCNSLEMSYLQHIDAIKFVYEKLRKEYD